MSFSVLIGSQAAFAEVVTVDFEMEVTEVDDVDNLLGGTVVLGDIMTGSYTYDTNAPDLFPAQSGRYQIDAFSFQLDSISFESNPSSDPGSDIIIIISDIAPSDRYSILVRTLEQQSGPPLPNGEIVFSFTLADNTETLFSDDSLPPFPPPLSSFGEKFGFFDAESLDEEDFVEVNAIVTSITVQTDDEVVGGEIIPIESASLLLAGAQTFSWMIPVVLSVLGIGLFVVSRKSENS